MLSKTGQMLKLDEKTHTSIPYPQSTFFYLNTNEFYIVASNVLTLYIPSYFIIFFPEKETKQKHENFKIKNRNKTKNVTTIE